MTSLVSRGALGRAIEAHLEGGSNVLASLVLEGELSERLLDGELERSGTPCVSNVFPMRRACERVPPGLLRALYAVPVHEDPRSGLVEVAALDPSDPHVRAELSYHLGAPIRLVRAPLGLLREALRALERRPSSAPVRPVERRVTPAYLSLPDIADAAGVPVLRHGSDRPIPLVRPRTALTRGADGEESDNEPIPLLSHPPPARETGEVPYALEAPRGPFPDPSPLLAAIDRAESRDEVLDLLLNGVAMVAARAAIFVVRKGEVRCFRAPEGREDDPAFRELVVPLSAPSVFATSAATGHYLGPVPKTAVHAGLGAIRGDVAVVPVRAKGALAAFLYAEAVGDSMIGTKRMIDLARVAGEAFTRLVQRGARA